MLRKRSYLSVICCSFFMSTSSVFYALLSLAQPQRSIVSPNGRYKAVLVPIPPRGLHYEIRDTNTNRTLFTTREQRGRTQNDVKAGRFSQDSTQFAAAYHYGHKGRYTWIGVWTLVNNVVLYRSQTLQGFVRNIPNSAFVNFQGVWWTIGCYCTDGYSYRTVSIKSCMVHEGGAGWSCASLANRLGSRTNCQSIQIIRNPDNTPCDAQLFNFQIISNNFQLSPSQETGSVSDSDRFGLLFPSSITGSSKAPVAHFSEMGGCKRTLPTQFSLFENISLGETLKTYDLLTLR